MTQHNETRELPKMYTIPELAKLGVMPERAIRRLVKERAFPVTPIGSKTLINIELFNDYLYGRLK